MLHKGDNVSVFVTVVQPLGKVCQVWAQTDAAACRVIETLMTVEEDQLTSRKVSPDCVAIGDIFLAKFHEDMKWYRAKVKHVDKANQRVNVFFIDYGNEEDLQFTELVMGEGKHFEIPPQASLFVLGEIQAKNNHEWTDIEIAGLNEQLLYGEFAGVVLNGSTVGNPPTIRLFTDETGSESLATEVIAAGFGARANVGMEEPLEQSVLETNCSYHVYVVFYDSPMNFWIQRMDRQDVLNQLQDTIASEITDSSPGVSHVTVGTVCTAKFCDTESNFETFYRAVVTGVHPDGTCTVLYMDYGNSERLSLNKLKAIPPLFKELPSQAIQCCLHGSLANADQFLNMLQSEHIYTNVVSVMDSGLHVVTLSEGQSMQPQITSHEPISSNGTSQNTFSNDNTIIHRSYKPPQFDVGKQVDLCISHVEPSGKFYCQLLENGPRLNQLMHTLDERYRISGTPLNIPTPGIPCVTRSILDRCVYRSMIINLDNHTITVQHTDFGLTEDVPTENVLVIDEDLMEMPSQSIYCSLSDSDNHSATAVATLLKRYESQTALVGSVMLKSGQLYEMQLVDTSGILDVYLVKELERNCLDKSRMSELSYSKVNLKEGQWTDIQVTYIGDPANVFCQFVSTQEELYTLMSQIESYCSSGSAMGLPHLEAAMPCLAKYSEDGAWYRAVIVGTHPSGHFNVYFVDYGNHDLLAEDNLKAIPPELMILPRQCFRGVLDGLVGAAGLWSDEETALLFDMAAEQNHPTLVVKHEAHDDVYIIQIFSSTGSCINQNYGNKIRKLSPTFTSRGPPGLSKGQTVQTITSIESRSDQTLTFENGKGWAQWEQPVKTKIHQEIKPLEVQPGYKNIIIETIVNPGEFYCRLTESDEALFDFMDHINADYLNLAPDDLLLPNITQGMVCCAKFNNAWYRAKVLSISNKSAVVQYVDFGNTEVVSLTDIKQLKPDLNKMPAQALKCSLAGIVPAGESWSDESGTVFENIMGESPTVGAFTECGSDGIYLIEVVQSIQGGQILFHEELVKCGIALNQEPQKPEVDQVLLHGNRRRQVSSNSSSTSSHNLHVSHKYSKPPITASQTVDVNVVHVETPTEFWVQLTQNCTDLENLMDSLQTFYANLGTDQYRIQSAKPDMTCVACFSEDQMWYRAEVVRELRGELLIRYVDYGNYEKRTISDLWEIQPEFMKLPAQAIQCSLHDVVAPPTGWAITTKDTLVDMVLDKNLLAEVVSVSLSPQILTVKLIETKEQGQLSIADQLIQRKLAVCSTPPRTTSQQRMASAGRTSNETQQVSLPHADLKAYQPQSIPVKDIPTQDVKIGDSLKVNIVWANSPTSFWCQRVGSQMAIQELVENLSAHYETLRIKEAEIPNPQPGQLCVALYNADGNWYRSRVLRTQNREAEVLYVDFGNKECLPWSKLKEIKPQFLDVPQMALHCTLEDMGLYNDNYDQTVELYFLEVMAQDLRLLVQALPKDGEEVYTVAITDKEGNDVARQINQIGGKSHFMSQKVQSQLPTVPATVPRQALQLPQTPPRSEQPPNVAFKMLDSPIGPGNSIDLIVSNIEAVDSFYCQLTANTEGLDSFMSNLEAHYASGKVSPLTPAELKVKMPCAARFSEDNYWYRAMVKHVLSAKEVEVVFVDYANSEITSIEKVYPLLPRFAGYPVQAFQCTLSGMVSTSSADELNHFRQLVEGKTLLGTVIHEGKKLELELTDKGTGTNINSEMISKFSSSRKGQPATISSPTENFPSAQLPTGNAEVYITHVDSPASFWVQLASQETEVEAFANNMQELYDTLAPDEGKLMDATINRPCAARFSEDDAWYRGTIENKTGNEVTVRFIDYGNTDSASLADLKNITPGFLIVPPFAIHCQLDGVTEPTSGWMAEQKLALQEIATTLTATFSQTGTPTAVKLKTDGVDVALRIGLVVEEAALSCVGAKYTALSVPSTEVTVYATHIEDRFIYVQLQTQADYLQTVSEKLQDVYGALSEDYLNLDTAQEGDACVAQFAEDEAWYRASIESVTDQQVHVRFIDFGNGEVTARNTLKQLTPELLQDSPFAFKCQLHGVPCPPYGLPDGFTEMLEEQLMDTEISATFLSTQEPFIVKLVVTGEDFSKTVQERFPQFSENIHSQVSSQVSTQPPDPTEIPKLPKQSVGDSKQNPQTTFASHVENPHCIFLQLDSDSDKLQNVTDTLQDTYSCMADSELPVHSTEVGTTCVAKFSEDDAWYRAVIEASNPEIIVRFIDFGNVETMTSKSLKQLTPDLMCQPALGFRCRLHEVSMPSSGWPEGLQDKLDGLIMDQELQTVFLDDESPFLVKMVVGEDDVNIAVQHYINLSTNDPYKETSENVKEPVKESDVDNGELPKSEAVKMSETVYVAAVDFPNLFYVQKESEADTLAELMEQMSGFCESLSPLNNPTAGQLCCAKYSGDGAWYRAIITNVDENIRVQFCDYGNYDTVKTTDLQTLHDPLRHVPAFSVAYQLAGANSLSWTDEQTDQFIEMTSDKALVIKELDDGTSPPSIRLFEGDVDINLAMGCTPLADVDIESEEDFQEAAEDLEQVSQGSVAINAYEEVSESKESEEISAPIPSQEIKRADTTEEQSQSEFEEVTEIVEVHQEDPAGSNIQMSSELVQTDDPCQEIGFEDITRASLESETFHEITREVELSQEVATTCTTQELSEISEPSEFQEAVDEVEASLEKLTLATTSDVVTTHESRADLSSEASEEFADAVDEVEDKAVLQLGDRIEVEVVHIISPSQFWCLRVDARDECENMMASVAECCESVAASGNFSKGETCGVRHTDGEWCRISVTSVEDEQVGAFFIDYGNTENVYKSDLRPLSDVLKKTPGFALPSRLHGVKSTENVWSNMAILCFKELSLNKMLLAEIISVGPEEQNYTVKLLDMGISVATTLIEKGHVVEGDFPAYEISSNYVDSPKSEAQSPEKSEEYTYRDLDQAKSTLFFAEDANTIEFDISMLLKSELKYGERAEVLISHIKSFDSIFVQLKKQQCVLHNLMDEMQEAYDTVSDATEEFKTTIGSGLICAARSSENDMWYRAHVLDAIGGAILGTVQFVDYGMIETVEVNKLQVLKPKFRTQPQQSIRCKVYCSEELSTDAFDSFVADVQEKTLLAEVVEIVECDTPSLKLLDMGTCVLSRLTLGDHGSMFAVQEINTLKDVDTCSEESSEASEMESPGQYRFEDAAVIKQTTSEMVENLEIVDKFSEQVTIQSQDTENDQPVNPNNYQNTSLEETSLDHFLTEREVSDTEEINTVNLRIATEEPGMEVAEKNSSETIENESRAEYVNKDEVIVEQTTAVIEQTTGISDVHNLEIVNKIDEEIIIQSHDMEKTPPEYHTARNQCEIKVTRVVACNDKEPSYEVIPFKHLSTEKVVSGTKENEGDNLPNATPDLHMKEVTEENDSETDEMELTAQYGNKDDTVKEQTTSEILGKIEKQQLACHTVSNQAEIERVLVDNCNNEATWLGHPTKKQVSGTVDSDSQSDASQDTDIAKVAKENDRETFEKELPAQYINEDKEIIEQATSKIDRLENEDHIEKITVGFHDTEKDQPECYTASNQVEIGEAAAGACNDKEPSFEHLFTVNDLLDTEEVNHDISPNASQDFDMGEFTEGNRSETFQKGSSAQYMNENETVLEQTTSQMANLGIVVKIEQEITMQSRATEEHEREYYTASNPAKIEEVGLDACATQGVQIIEYEDVQLTKERMLPTSDNVCGAEAAGKQKVIEEFFLYTNDEADILQFTNAECSEDNGDAIKMIDSEEEAQEGEGTNNANMDDGEEKTVQEPTPTEMLAGEPTCDSRRDNVTSNRDTDVEEQKSDMQPAGKCDQFCTMTAEYRGLQKVHVCYPSFCVGDELYVTASVTNSPYDFWCQLVQHSRTELPLLSDRIQDYCSENSDSSTLIDIPHVGMPCFAQCSRDGNWYRGVIEDVREDTVVVCFVDYGISERTNACNLQIVTPEFLELDVQAFKCRLAGVNSNDGAQWDATSCRRFEELLRDKDLRLTITAKTPGSMKGSEELTVILQDSDCSIADVLIDGGYAQTEMCREHLADPVRSSVFTFTPMKPEYFFDAQLCSGLSPDEFSLQTRGDSDKLELLLATLQETGPAADIKVGQAVLVHSKRAAVLEMTEEQCRVEYVDEGTLDTVPMSEVHELSAEGTALPRQAILCKLAGLSTTSWTQEALDYFEGFKNVYTLRAHVVAVEDTTHLVHLYDMEDLSGMSINSQLVSRGFAWVLPNQELLDLNETLLSTQDELETSFLEINRDRRPSLGEFSEEPVLTTDTEVDDEVLLYGTPDLAAGEVVQLMCISAKDPHNLVCQLTTYRHQIDALVKDLNNFDSMDNELINISQLHCGDACLAYLETENAWHRARVLAKEGDNLAVYFVDFGVSATVSLGNIRRIPKTAMALPAQALICSITAIKPIQEQWTEEAVAALRGACENKAVSALICSVEEDWKLVISIQIGDGPDVGDMLVNENHAARDEQDNEVMADAADSAEELDECIKDEGDDEEDVEEVAELSTQGGKKKSKSKKKKKKSK